MNYPTEQFLISLGKCKGHYPHGPFTALEPVQQLNAEEKLQLGYLNRLCDAIVDEQKGASKIRSGHLIDSWQAAFRHAQQIYTESWPCADVLVNHLAKHGNSVDAPLMWGFVNAGKKEEAFEQGYADGVQNARKEIATDVLPKYSDAQLATLSINLQKPIAGEDAAQSDTRRAMLAMVNAEIDRRKNGEPLPASAGTAPQTESLAAWSITKVSQATFDESHPQHREAQAEWMKRILESEPTKSAPAEKENEVSNTFYDESPVEALDADQAKAQASREYDAYSKVIHAAGFTSKDRYVSYRSAVLTGKHRTTSKGNMSTQAINDEPQTNDPAEIKEWAESKAKAEWAANPDIRKSWSTKDRFVTMRSREILGVHKSTGGVSRTKVSK